MSDITEKCILENIPVYKNIERIGLFIDLKHWLLKNYGVYNQIAFLQNNSIKFQIVQMGDIYYNCTEE